MKKYLNRVFIEGLTGMAHGLFSTLIVGTILVQLAKLIPNPYGSYVAVIGQIAMALTGAGIGIGLAGKLGASTFVTLGSAVSGLVAAHAQSIIAGTFSVGKGVLFIGPGEPLGAFVASLVAVEFGIFISGRTKLDLLLTPALSMLVGSFTGFLIGPPISKLLLLIGNAIEYGTSYQPFIMGIIVSVIMGMVLTLPISSAALGIVLGLSGIAAGAATVGCCCQMVGFAVASFRDNGVSGLITQGIGTSMVQVPNILRKPIFWLPPIFASAILGPVSTIALKMTNLPAGSGMGTSGLVGQIMTFKSMAGSISTSTIWLYVAILHFIAPAVLTLIFSEAFYRLGWIKRGDMKI